MTDHLARLLIELGYHPEKAQTLSREAATLAADFQLSEAELAALHSGSRELLQQTAGYGLWDRLIARGVVIMEPDDDDDDGDGNGDGGS